MHITARGRGILAATGAAALLVAGALAPGAATAVLPVPLPQPPVQTPPAPQLPSTPQLPVPDLVEPPSPPPVTVPRVPKTPAPPSPPSVPNSVGRSGGSGGGSGGGFSGGSVPSGSSDESAGNDASGGAGEGQRGARTRAQRRKASERRLRRSVRRNRNCLSSLNRFQQRVLVLRAGVATGGSPRTRRGVAKRLDVPVNRVALAESRGLGRLRTVARGGCDSAAPGSMTGWFDPSLPLAPLALATSTTASGSPASGSVPAGVERDADGAVLGDTRSDESEIPASGLATGSQAPARVAADAEDGQLALPVVLFTLLLLAGAGGYLLLLRRRRGAVATGGAGATVLEPPAADTRTANVPETAGAPPPGNESLDEPVAPWLLPEYEDEPSGETDRTPQAPRATQERPAREPTRRPSPSSGIAGATADAFADVRRRVRRRRHG